MHKLTFENFPFISIPIFYLDIGEIISLLFSSNINVFYSALIFSDRPGKI